MLVPYHIARLLKLIYIKYWVSRTGICNVIVINILRSPVFCQVKLSLDFIYLYSLFWFWFFFLDFYIQKGTVILSWIEFIPLADTQINKGQDKRAENSTTVHLNCCICLFQLRVGELPSHKGILKRLNETGGIALGSTSLNPDKKHKLESTLKEANHRLLKVRHITDISVV